VDKRHQVAQWGHAYSIQRIRAEIHDAIAVGQDLVGHGPSSGRGETTALDAPDARLDHSPACHGQSLSSPSWRLTNAHAEQVASQRHTM
jgi:hypothetical protein